MDFLLFGHRLYKIAVTLHVVIYIYICILKISQPGWGYNWYCYVASALATPRQSICMNALTHRMDKQMSSSMSKKIEKIMKQQWESSRCLSVLCSSPHPQFPSPPLAGPPSLKAEWYSLVLGWLLVVGMADGD